MEMKKRARAQSIVETVVGILFLIPIVLFLLDAVVLVLASTANDNLAKTVARAAASANDPTNNLGSAVAGYNAALSAASKFAESGIISKRNSSFVSGYCWNGLGGNESAGASWPQSIPTPNIGDVGVITAMTVHLPVPFPFLPSTVDFEAKAVEPVVSIAAGSQIGVAPDDSDANRLGNDTNPRSGQSTGNGGAGGGIGSGGLGGGGIGAGGGGIGGGLGGGGGGLGGLGGGGGIGGGTIPSGGGGGGNANSHTF